MTAIKPLTEYKWAVSGSALRLAPNSQLLNYGWTTSNSLITGIPEKPVLQYENGWRYIIYEWIDYLRLKTDETIGLPTTGQGANYFLKTNGVSNFSWAAVNQVPTTGQAADELLMTDGSSGFSWEAAAEVPAFSTVGYALTATGVSSYAWAAMYSSGSFTATMTCSSGTITLSSTGNNRTVFWYKVSNQYVLFARLVVSSVSSPTGLLQINTLPVSCLISTSLTISTDHLGSTISYGLQALIDSFTSIIKIYKFEASVRSNMADQVISNSIFFISGQYTST